jgi:hypothetical protein
MRPYYCVTAGWYGFIETDDFGTDVWNPSDCSYGVWQWWEHDLAAALAHLNDCQQQPFDFCCLQVAFNT